MNKKQQRELLFGESARAETVKRFDVHQLARFESLYDIDAVFTDHLRDVLLVELIDKLDKNIRHSHYLGSVAGPSLISLAGQALIPKFNPLNSSTRTSPDSKRFNTVGERPKMDDLTAELYTATNLFLIATTTIPRPYHLFADILDHAHETPSVQVDIGMVYGFNSVLKKWHPPRTMEEIISGLRFDYPTLREYSFQRMERILGAKSFLHRMPSGPAGP